VDIIQYDEDNPRSSFGPTWHTVDDNLAHIDRNTLKAVGQTLMEIVYNER
jgi:aminopeptidase-like protein